jgi:hypothetical protein
MFSDRCGLEPCPGARESPSCCAEVSSPAALSRAECSPLSLPPTPAAWSPLRRDEDSEQARDHAPRRRLVARRWDPH